MFSAVRAKRPFDVHQSYELIGGRIEVDAARPLTAEQQRWIERRITFRWMWKERRPAEVRANLRAILDELHGRYPELELARVRLWLIVDRAPAYPITARLDRYDLAMIGELDTGGSYRSALGRLTGDRTSIAVTASGLDLADPSSGAGGGRRGPARAGDRGPCHRARPSGPLALDPPRAR